MSITGRVSMHEWALAEAVVYTILSAAREKGAKKITEAEIKIGDVQQIEVDILATAIRELSKNTKMEKAKIKLEREETHFRCRACSFGWNFRDSISTLAENGSEAIHFLPELAHTFIRCPRCGSPDFEVVGRRGVWVEYIKISK
jgi:hydrogenase nickel incorporation protein HypA/HybF